MIARAVKLAKSKQTPEPEGKLKLNLVVPDLPYQQCSQCKGEVSRLRESGVCEYCEQENDEKRANFERKRRNLIAILGGEYPLENFTFEKFRAVKGNTVALNAAKAFDYKKHNAFFYGWAGAGKTHLAYAIAIKAYNQGVSKIAILTTEQLSRRITGNNFEAKEQTLKDLIAADLLILDDLCRKKETENTIDAVCEIIDYRKYAPRNGLIITSNLGLDQVTERLGEDRLASRIVGSCTRERIVKVEPRNPDNSEKDFRLDDFKLRAAGND